MRRPPRARGAGSSATPERASCLDGAESADWGGDGAEYPLASRDRRRAIVTVRCLRESCTAGTSGRCSAWRPRWLGSRERCRGGRAGGLRHAFDRYGHLADPAGHAPVGAAWVRRRKPDQTTRIVRRNDMEPRVRGLPRAERDALALRHSLGLDAPESTGRSASRRDGRRCAPRGGVEAAGLAGGRGRPRSRADHRVPGHHRGSSGTCWPAQVRRSAGLPPRGGSGWSPARSGLRAGGRPRASCSVPRTPART